VGGKPILQAAKRRGILHFFFSVGKETRNQKPETRNLSQNEIQQIASFPVLFLVRAFLKFKTMMWEEIYIFHQYGNMRREK